ncbi:T9SS type A sorting domain-containing protein [Flavitalea sp.]|nr:T9SS type A sorting domain-containing protein [Flavitalea sp.]
MMKRLVRYIHYCGLVILLVPGIRTKARAQQGFFLNDWKPKNITAPVYTEIAMPTAASTVTVNINGENIITKVPASLFGNNANPYMTQMVTEPVLIDHIKALSPNIIRYPGGNISSVFFWNQEKDAKPPTAPDSLFDSNGKPVKGGYWYGKNNEGWTLSLDNYYKMLQQTNSTGIITTNYSYARYGLGANPVTDAAHLAADWIRYDSGRTKYWEIGNEDAGPWQAGFKINTGTNSDGQPEIITGGLYGQHLKIFADSMRKAAKELGVTIYIGAQLIQYDAAASWNPPDRNWNAAYFAEAGNTADFYIVHSYYSPFGENSTAVNILKTAADETRAIMNWMKTTTTKAGVELKPIALTEWNIFAEGSMQSVSHVNGLHATLVLGELIEQKYGMASRWDLANGWGNGNDHGTFNSGDEPGGVPRWNPRPSFYHMYYFQKFFGDQMIQSTVTGSQDIVSYASSFSSGQLGSVIVNKGNSAKIVKIATDAFTVGRYYWYTLTGSNDNGEFSRKVLVNGNGPTGVSGGPLNYPGIAANSTIAQGEVKIEIPARAAVYVLLEKGAITAVRDIDPADKIVKLYPNPSKDGSFYLRIRDGLILDKASVQVINTGGQLVEQRTGFTNGTLLFSQPLISGNYQVVIKLAEGVTIKRLVVQ